ncbi:12311_t:CDS:2, partial [Gigaspora margarita]
MLKYYLDFSISGPCKFDITTRSPKSNFRLQSDTISNSHYSNTSLTSILKFIFEFAFDIGRDSKLENAEYGAEVLYHPKEELLQNTLETFVDTCHI